ncbi:hypothetical protein F4778DRAFT_721801 [Xylariomycetidae sp. FL2044]|nr:hypothetical protein F4778DRAFT_721801 [Xylariomycetidae sp. FL2044]
MASVVSTCGYLTGDPAQGWAAPAGYGCRIDTANGLWGFCPTTVIAATDCGLGGYCFDTDTCTSGCGRLVDNPTITTWTCTPSDPSSRYCSMAMLTVGVDQTYEYFHCGPDANTAHYMASPTAAVLLTSGAEPSSSSWSHSTTSSTLPTSASSQSQTSGGAQAGVSMTASVSGSSSSGNNIGAIIGGVIGGLVVIGAFGIAAIFMLLRYRRHSRAYSKHERLPPEPGTRPESVKQIIAWAPPAELPVNYPTHLSPQPPVELPASYGR